MISSGLARDESCNKEVWAVWPIAKGCTMKGSGVGVGSTGLVRHRHGESVTRKKRFVGNKQARLEAIKQLRSGIKYRWGCCWGK